MDKICNIEVSCTYSKDKNVVTTNVYVIHFCNFQNYDNWLQKLSSYVILYICHLAYQNGMNHESSHPIKRNT